MAIANKLVPQNWKEGYAAEGHGSLKTDGSLIWSFGLSIGFTSVTGKKVAWDYTAPAGHFQSTTTSKHVYMVKAAADLVLVPNDSLGDVWATEETENDYATTVAKGKANDSAQSAADEIAKLKAAVKADAQATQMAKAKASKIDVVKELEDTLKGMPVDSDDTETDILKLGT